MFKKQVFFGKTCKKSRIFRFFETGKTGS